MLEPKSALTPPLPKIEPNRSLFVLLTPEMFKQNPESRLYGFLMQQYRKDPESLARDLPHRKGIKKWDAVSRRLGWLTWEDCERILRGSCRCFIGTST